MLLDAMCMLVNRLHTFLTCILVPQLNNEPRNAAPSEVQSCLNAYAKHKSMQTSKHRVIATTGSSHHEG
eukprot:3478510-Lingulodinium_polyedra.AAC.1